MVCQSGGAWVNPAAAASGATPKQSIQMIAGRKTRKDTAVTQSLDSFKCRKKLKVGNKTYIYYSLKAAEKNGLKGVSKLPFSLKVLLENLLRFEDGGFTVSTDDIQAIADWQKNPSESQNEIQYRPARVLLALAGLPLIHSGMLVMD